MARSPGERLVERRILWLAVVSAWLWLMMPPAVFAAEAGPKHSTPEVSQPELLGYLAHQQPFVLIDARSPEEYSAGHVQGAINIPFDQLEHYQSQLPDQRTEALVLYCRSGKRARLLKAALLDKGFSNIRVLSSEQLLFQEHSVIFNCGV